MVEPIKIADIPVMPFESVEHVLSHVFSEADSIKPGVAIAINPEKILKSLECEQVKHILLNATVQYADGIGVVKAMEKKSGKKLQRIPGVELWLEVVKKASENNGSVYLVGAKPEVSEKAEQKLIDQFNINIAGRSDGYFKDRSELIGNIIQSKADVVIVALGSPKQEAFIDECKKQHPNAFYMGVGGSLDVLVGNVERAPEAWCKYNLEWLYRLLKEPTRLKRQIKLLKFVYLYLRGRL
ncbi:WecB/TagA/CpsF family glycosyltransferase [Pseudoalteromonas sp. G4]|uniref:WecB/TagA/CpsF family glycosyltransferase n=1 Tax=Pseudoalteromonas sp. G4 TaxID=2992761 RepID=UPI00237E9181|nr:WecB/TagA/CpsF family glycosyltransferase [Pseudoalteromonas sp. G4]MDE3271256.1 WecB/TagA/CpsF family glycosyltransferase [Pseudoalteromonas sp. G4]